MWHLQYHYFGRGALEHLDHPPSSVARINYCESFNLPQWEYFPFERYKRLGENVSPNPHQRSRIKGYLDWTQNLGAREALNGMEETSLTVDPSTWERLVEAILPFGNQLVVLTVKFHVTGKRDPPKRQIRIVDLSSLDSIVRLV
jgi:hypothetical protein